MRWEYDATLALHEAVRMKVTGDSQIRDVTTVSTVDPSWEGDVLTALSLLRWLDDYYTGLSPEDRASLEKEPEEIYTSSG